MQKEIRFHVLSERDYLSELNSLVKLLRVPDERHSLDLRPFLSTVRRAVREISAKRRRGEAISEHEKWTYENSHLLRRAAIRYSDKSRELPSVEKEPRIVTIVRFAMIHSETFDKETLLKTLNLVQNETALTLAEIESLPNAIGYVAAEGLSIVADRILYHNRMKYRAEKEPSDTKFFTSDIYNYYLLRASQNRDRTLADLRTHGVNPKGADAAFTLSVMENDELARKFFTALGAADELAPVYETVQTTEIYKTLASSAEFKKMSFDTRLYYLNFVAKTAKKVKKDEIYVAEKLVEFDTNNASVGCAAFENPRGFQAYVKSGKTGKTRSIGGLKAAGYFASILITAGLATAITVLLTRSFFALFLLLPLFFTAEKCVNILCAKRVKRQFLPRMNFDEIPVYHRTLAVVSEYIGNLGQLKDSVKHLKVLREGNALGAVDFALLIDFAAADSEETEADEALIEYLKTELRDEGLNAFVRRRVQAGDRFAGYERKRGAIEDLSFFLSTGNAEAFRFVLKSPQKPEFVVLLDSDNTVEPGGILEMVNLIAHPANHRYDLMSATGRYRLETPKTAYSKRFYRDGGLESYPHYSSFFFDLFGRDVFCGKGIYRLNSYEKKLSGIFPDGKILSHDILEGAVLETASGGVVYEEAPETFLQEEERVTRWQRGDLQLLPFAGRGWKNRKGEKYRSELPVFYRLLILRNALAVFSPIALFAAVAVGVYVAPWLTVAAIITIFLPFCVDFVREIRSVAERRRLRYALKGVWYSLKNAVEEFCLIPYRAVKNLSVALSTALKMFFKKNLLVWKTYYMTRSERAAGVAVRMAVPSLIVNTGITAGLYFVVPALVVPYAIYAVLTLIALTALNAASCPRASKTPKEEEFLKDAAYRTCKYFDLMRAPNALPADNYQERPYRGKSATTSPTNLGYALVAEISSFYLGYRDRDETVRHLSELLYKYENLKKWKGNLYNWYAPDGTPKGSFVSSVDSGNFAACLLIAEEFLKEIGETALAVRFRALFDGIDLTALLDKERELMYLGVDAKTRRKSGHYDMLMSESRLTSYLVAAKIKNPAAFRNLIRDYTGLCGNTLLSWSGTMFEYLMPAIFLRCPEGSLIRDSERRAVKIQMRRRFRGIWGRSEGGYHAFDNDLNYQYYAIGEERLSVRNEPNNPVVTPYSAALALDVAPRQALRNLKRLRKIGAYGEYGFYEAVDFSDGETKFVESYMTHHQGMLLSALTNRLKGDILKRLLEKSLTVRGASLLLTEKTSERVYSIKVTKTVRLPAKKTLEYYDKSINQEYSEKIFGLTDAKNAVFGDNLGNTAVRLGSVSVGTPFGTGCAPTGGFFYVETKGGVRSPTVYPSGAAGEYESGQTESELFYRNKTAGIELTIRKNDNFSAVTKRLKIDAPTGKQIKVAYIEELVLNEADAYLSHPVFNGMFVETSYLADRKTIVAEKRSGMENDDRFYALVVRGMSELMVETDRKKLIGRGRSVRNPAILDEFKTSGEADTGDVLEPAFGFSGLTEFARDGTATVELTLVTARTKEELIKTLDTVPHEFYRYAERSQSVNLYRDAFSAGLVTRLCLANRPAYPGDAWKDDGKAYREYNRGGLGITYRSGDSVQPFEKLINALKCAESFGLNVFLNVELPKNPDNRMKKAIDEAAKRLFFDKYRILNEKESETAARECFLTLDADLTLNQPRFLKDRMATLPRKESSARPVENESYAIRGENGGFLENGDFLLTGKAELPFSNVVAFGAGGFAATENGGGFAFYGNSRENKQNEFGNDPVTDAPGEALLFGSKRFLRLNKGASATRYTPGKITWYGDYPGLKSRVEQYLVRDGAVRVMEADIVSDEKNASIYYGFRPALDWKAVRGDVIFKGENGVLSVKNRKTGNCIFVRIVSESAKNIAFSDENERYPWIAAELNGKDHRIFILIANDERALLKLGADEIASEKAETMRQIEALSPITAATGNPATDILLNRWLMPQIRFSRLNARAGYYQAGGAVGFRDQLQDVVALLSTDPGRVREQILDAARHQYKEGDVQHWWHPPRFGIRTRISDDKLFLVLVTAKYLRSTGDIKILDEELPYLVSEPLKAKEMNRLEYPAESKETESLLKHCLKALKSAMRYGENGLLILGTGDWNDGIDEAGKKLKGESVVTSLLLIWAVKEFADFIADGNLRIEILGVAERLKDAVHRSAYRDGQYLRLRSDEGKWYGTGEGALKIDLVSESLAVLSGTANPERAESALEKAEQLVDRDLKIIKLLAPPLGKKNYLGYLSKYPKGVRENGGQYTHAAIWYLMALAEAGKPEKAYEYFKMINPAEKFSNREVYARYAGEPFVLSGDVYSNKRNEGRMGWSWYTGSAAWCYHFLTECLFGLRRVGNELEIMPNLPAELDGTVVVYRYENSEYRITLRKTGTKRLMMDGVMLETEGKIPLLKNRRAEIVAEC